MLRKVGAGACSNKEAKSGAMAARISDQQKKKIIADYVQLGNYAATAKINGCSLNTVKKIVQNNAEVAEMCNQKMRENTADVIEYMEGQKRVVCEIIGKGLAALNDPRKLAGAPPNQITTAIGTLIDKWTAIKEMSSSGDEEVTIIIDV